MMRNVKNLKQAVMPIIWLNCIFCMGIFEMPINRPRYFLSVCYVILIMTGYFVMFYKGMYIFQKSFQAEFIIFYYVLGINIAVALLAIILYWWKKKTVNIIIKRSNIADCTFEAFGIKSEYHKLSQKIMALLAIWTVGAIIIIITNAMWTHRGGYWLTFYNCVCVCFPILINSVVDLTFASFIKCLQVRFQKTNTLISNIVFCVNESDAFKIHNWKEKESIAFVMANYKNRKSKIMHLIQTLRHVHLELTRIGRQINGAYCLQLLLEMAVHVTIVTATTYCLYCVFSNHLHIIVTTREIIAMTMWGLIYSIKIILVNWLCTSVSSEAYKTGELIQSFEGSIIDDDMREEIHQFTQQIMLKSLNFTAFGFFTIDNCLTGKFFATVATYVVILIQMNTSLLKPLYQHN